MRKLNYIIPAEYDDKTVEKYLKQAHGFSRRILTRLKHEPMHITLNGSHVRMIDTLREGDKLQIILAEESHIEPNSELVVPIIYEDEDIIVFNKPARMPVHPSLGHHTDTLANFFTAHMLSKGEDILFRPINRLDIDTQGLCLVAKNSLSASCLRTSVKKEYTAVLCGVLQTKSGVINLPISREYDSIIKRVVSEGGQDSITEYEVAAQNEQYTMVKVHLKTGRTHQIRVHFSHIGFPLVGDLLYGGDTSVMSGQALCCNKLQFMHPIVNKQLEFCINIQESWLDLLK